jgi:hypothetical protein
MSCCDGVSNYYFPDGCCSDAIEYPCETRYEKQGCCVQGKFWRVPGNLIVAAGVTLLVLSLLAMTKQMTLPAHLHDPFFFTGVAVTGLTLVGLFAHYVSTTCCNDTNQRSFGF